jgi:hypothetical protein
MFNLLTVGALIPAANEQSVLTATLYAMCWADAGSWSVKGADSMAQPHVQLTVRDKRGKLLEAVQESPQVGNARGYNSIVISFNLW